MANALLQLIDSCTRWFVGADEGYVHDFADDLGWEVRRAPRPHVGKVVLYETETGITTEPLTIERAGEFLDMIEQRNFRARRAAGDRRSL